MTDKILLFVASDSPRSSYAEANLRQLLGMRPDSDTQAELEVIDVIERPELADEWLVLATPLVVHVARGTVRRAVGDFSDLRRLADAINLPYFEAPHEKGTA